MVEPKTANFTPLLGKYPYGSKFTDALSNTVGLEGSKPDMSGVGGRGISLKGVTQKTWDDYSKKRGMETKDVRQLNEHEVAAMYYTDYYKGPKFDTLPPRIAKQAFDFGVQHGQGTAARSIQRIVGTKRDGDLGPKSQKAIQDYIKVNGEDKLINEMINDRVGIIMYLVRTKPKEFKPQEKGLLTRVQKDRPNGKN
jgi:lysozyme family protein